METHSKPLANTHNRQDDSGGANIATKEDTVLSTFPADTNKTKYKDEEYDICKEACINDGCYLPPSHEFHRARANTPVYLRAYYYLKGWTDCQKENSESIKPKEKQNGTR